MSATCFEDLLNHQGHHIECAVYGTEAKGIVNVAVECMDCSEVLMDFDKPEGKHYPIDLSNWHGLPEDNE